jgi:hypothetical protein
VISGWPAASTAGEDDMAVTAPGEDHEARQTSPLPGRACLRTHAIKVRRKIRAAQDAINRSCKYRGDGELHGGARTPKPDGLA